MGKRAWQVALVAILGLAGGCAGGQTGHTGESEAMCGELLERNNVSYEEAAELGFDVRTRLEERAVGPDGVEHELLLLAPPELWIKRGMTAPVDRAVEASLRIWPNRTFWFFSDPDDLDADVAACGYSGFFGVEVELTIPSLELTLSGTGREDQLHAADPEQSERPRGTAEIEIDELGRCRWGDHEELYCNHAVFGSAACLDRSTWRAEPEVQKAELGVLELLERVVAALPSELSCAGGRGSVPFELHLAASERVCVVEPSWYSPTERDWYPLTATIALGDSEADRAAAVAVELMQECFIGRWDCSGEQCDWIDLQSTVEEPNPQEPVGCDRAVVSFDASSDTRVELQLHVEPSGKVNATVLVSEEPAEHFLHCGGSATFTL